MLMILIRRVVKVDRTNRQQWSCIGPFKSHRTAERALLRLSGVFSTLSATIWNEQQIAEMVEKARVGLLRYEDAEIFREMHKAFAGATISIVP